MHHMPEVAVVHDFASEKEMDDMIAAAKGKTKSTPYIEHGMDKGFSKKRTSKIMYMNEILTPEAERMSQNIAMLTKLYLKSDQYASENFQIMNYGIGGKISYHTDALPIQFGKKGMLQKINITFSS